MKPAVGKIAMVASEAYPFAKVGGLGDVVSALATALCGLGVETIVYLPWYRQVGKYPSVLPEVGGTTYQGVEFRFLYHPEFYDRPGIYDSRGKAYPDNLERFAYMSKRALEAISAEGFHPDLIHVHDWETALIPPLCRTSLARHSLCEGVPTVLTIHNLAYQGIYPAKKFPLLGLPSELFSIEGLEYYGQINLLKGGIIFADAVTTVSPTYAREIISPKFGEGLEGVIQFHGGVTGILNGLDTDIWNPATDPLIPVPYSIQEPSGKTACKAAVFEEFGLVDPSRPLAVFIGRLAVQKGVDLLIKAMESLGSEPIAWVILGSGDPAMAKNLQKMAAAQQGKIGIRIGHDESLAHRLYAAADIFLMPSHFEPCGLGQMIAMRYGAIPVVSPRGGLKDTVTEINPDKETGEGVFLKEMTARGLARAIRKACRYWQQDAPGRKIMARAMARDFSWKRSAKKYLELYRSCFQ